MTDDGWFTKRANQKVVLILTSVTWPQALRDYRIHVDGIRFPLDEELKGIVTAEEISSYLSIPVATRAVGTWLLKSAGTEDYLAITHTGLDMGP